MLSYSLYIGGKDVEGVGWVYTVSAKSLLEDVFTSVRLKRALERDPDPASPAAQHPYVVGRCAVVGDDEIDLATEAAAGAVREWAAFPLAQRLEFGARFREQLIAHRETILEILVAEAHPITLARWELTCLLQGLSPESISYYESQMHAEYTHGGRRLIIRRQADGVVGIHPPQNAPLPNSGLAIPILMAGNAVVVRAPRSIALSTLYILRGLAAPLLEEMGAPPGTLNVICGRPQQTLDRWLEHPAMNDILYSGGSPEGLRFEQECLKRGKKPILELAGNDGVVVWKDADIPNAVQAITESFFGSGQICMVPNYVIVHPDIADELIERLRVATEAVRPGYPDDESVLLSPVRRSERFFALLRQALEAGGQLIAGGHRVELDGSPSQAGQFLQATAVRTDGLLDARERFDMVREETFFPLLPVVVPEPTPDDVLLDQVIDFVNANAYGLRNSLWSRSPAVVDEFVRHVRNGGMLKVNDSHIGFLPYLPTHGGTGLTSGAFGEANYPILKASHLQGVSISEGVSPRVAMLDL
ncbi:aldehyde dehydrogenase family protein [Phytohabitans houttuyneae]|uniref:aldehyde dehydrogenase family protein n=1 Tax=Phytohabitans houttuyneae TaxID=1076126 RepID=UPI0015648C52|nr:aldehyde dehydrogenase [Phytohabitans houttuyneae]